MGAPLTQERLKELLRYDPDTGVFTWVKSGKGIKPSKVAGSTDRDGYCIIRVDRAIYRAHRLAFLYVTGEWPTHHVDHSNGARSDNRWCNLREATRSENMQNQRVANRDSAVGLLGVSKARGKFVAHITLAGKKTHLGVFTAAEDAHAAYLEAKFRMHPFQTLKAAPT